ncbi:MAG: hypothetical protein IBX36_04085 [Dehalococcoidia bacterium]|nr:hypothetical protein [Dehalococcoidia bacterium]
MAGEEAKTTRGYALFSPKDYGINFDDSDIEGDFVRALRVTTIEKITKILP